jgi:chemotaxis protein CheD
MTRPSLPGTRSVIVQGECKVSSNPNDVIATILGSCIAACIRDPLAVVGGMNHFLLPGDLKSGKNSGSEAYGVHLMEVLLNSLMVQGADRGRLEAKIFGGARMISGLSDIGRKNADFANRFLKHEGIPVLAEDIGGDRGRRIEYWPCSGRVRQIYMAASDVPQTRPIARKPVHDIELF